MEDIPPGGKVWSIAMALERRLGRAFWTRLRRDRASLRVRRRARRQRSNVQRPRTISTPLRIWARRCGASLPTRDASASRSMVTICEAFATEAFGNPEARAVSSTFPGASAQRRLLVSGTQIVVAMRLRLSAFPWMTTTGRRKPGAEPDGVGSSAHQTSPWTTSTTRCAPTSWLRQR